eukprot:COSAG02_NODE_58492_length_277_cov_0.584270_1_plen_41_part_01
MCTRTSGREQNGDAASVYVCLECAGPSAAAERDEVEETRGW